MPDFLRQLFSSGDFMPHGYCYLWDKGLVWLHVISDSTITLAYFVIPVVLLWFVRKRRDIPFNWMFVCFGVFIVACGSTHAMEVWNLWHADYWLAGMIKAITAVASLGTAVLLIQLMPRVVDLPNPQQMQKVIDELHQQAELLDLAHDAIFVRDMNGRLGYWNRGAEQAYGWTSAEASGRKVQELLHSEYPQPLAEIEDAVLNAGVWEGEIVHRRRDGARITVASRWSLRRGPDGHPVSILEVNRDITARKKAESKFQALLEAAPDAMVIVNEQGTIVLTNSQTSKLFGYIPQELLGQPVEVLIPEALRVAHRGHRNDYSHAPRARAMGEGLELSGRRKDGSEFPVEISLSPLETAEGTLITSAIRDITDRKKAELKFRALLEAAPDAMVIVNHLGRIALANAQTEKLFGYTRQELLGQPVEMLMPQAARKRHESHRDAYNSAPRTRPIHSGLDLVGRRKDGSEFPAEISLSPLQTAEGTFVTSAIRDITERKQIEAMRARHAEELGQANRELADANKELESFTYSVSHDLRAPLRHIDGFSRILLDEYKSKLDDSGRHYLQRVADGAKQMGRLVDDLLNFSRLGRQELKRQSANLTAIVENVRVDLAESASGRNVEWKVASLPAVECDPALIKIVFTNLLSNALKFTAPRGQTIIELGCSEEEDQPAFFVRDNGVGFDTKYADKLFGVFQRLHRQEDFEGTGVGLAIVQRIIHKHGGRIWAKSAPDRGATFYFTLPSKSQELHEAGTVKEGMA